MLGMQVGFYCEREVKHAVRGCKMSYSDVYWGIFSFFYRYDGKRILRLENLLVFFIHGGGKFANDWTN